MHKKKNIFEKAHGQNDYMAKCIWNETTMKLLLLKWNYSSVAVLLNHYKGFKPWFVAVPFLIFSFSSSRTSCTCSNMMSTLLFPSWVQNAFTSPEIQISIYKFVQLPESLKIRVAQWFFQRLKSTSVGFFFYYLLFF